VKKKYFLEFREVSYRVGSRIILDKVSFSIYSSQNVVILGANGAGKSTLILILAGLFKPFSGKVLLNSREVSFSNLVSVSSVVFQDPEPQIVAEDLCFQLAFSLENLAFPPKLIDRKIDKLLNLFGLLSRKNDSLSSFSFGEKQIVAFLSAAIINPAFLILDEALNMVSDDFFARFLAFKKISQSTFISVTHDISRISSQERLLILKEGRLVFDGTFLELMNKDNLSEFLFEAGIGVPDHVKLFFWLKKKRIFRERREQLESIPERKEVLRLL